MANKIWNAAKFIINSNVSENDIKEAGKRIYNKENKEYNKDSLAIEDKWILNKLDKLVFEVTTNIENYDLGIALDKIYNFIWNEFCDWYIEMVKPRIYSDNYEIKTNVCYILNYVFGTALKLLHPFMPFVTTKIYSELVSYDNKDLMISNWPEVKKNFSFENEEKLVEQLKETIVEIRNVRANMNIHPSKKSELIFVSKSNKKELEQAKEFILKLGFGKWLKIQENKDGIKDNAIGIIKGEIELYIPFEGLVDLAEEKKRLEAEKEKLENEVLRCEKMLSNPGFVNKAPESKIKEEKEKLAKYNNMLQNVKSRLDNI